MTSALNHLRRAHTQSFWAGVLLFAYLFKAIIPLGYMPDTNALEKGVFKIVMCTMGGAVDVVLDKDFKPVHPDKHKSKNDICPYSLGNLTTLTYQAVPLFIYLAHSIIIEHSPLSFSLEERANFGNASPRSPPFIG